MEGLRASSLVALVLLGGLNLSASGQEVEEEDYEGRVEVQEPENVLLDGTVYQVASYRFAPSAALAAEGDTRVAPALRWFDSESFEVALAKACKKSRRLALVPLEEDPPSGREAAMAAAESAEEAGAEYVLLAELTRISLGVQIKQLRSKNKTRYSLEPQVKLKIRVVEARSAETVNTLDVKAVGLRFGGDRMPALDALLDMEEVDPSEYEEEEQEELKLEARERDQLERSFKRLREVLAAATVESLIGVLFPIKVVETDEKAVWLDRGRGQGLRSGQELTAYEEGEDGGIVRVARVRVTHVKKRLSRAVVVPSAEGRTPGVSIGAVCR